MPAETLVVCLGDSNTQGQFSANYVKRLQDRWPGTRFINAGVNGQLAYNITQRLDEVVAQQPDVVTLLVGTNDVNAQFDASWLARYRKQQRLPVDPTRSWFGEQIDVILTRLSETPARLAVLDLPPLGEDLASRMNQLVDQYNDTLRDVAAQHSVPVLPLHERLVALLPEADPPPVCRGPMAGVSIHASARGAAAELGLDQCPQRAHAAHRQPAPQRSVRRCGGRSDQ